MHGGSQWRFQERKDRDFMIKKDGKDEKAREKSQISVAYFEYLVHTPIT